MQPANMENFPHNQFAMKITLTFKSFAETKRTWGIEYYIDRKSCRRCVFMANVCVSIRTGFGHQSHYLGCWKVGEKN